MPELVLVMELELGLKLELRLVFGLEFVRCSFALEPELQLELPKQLVLELVRQILLFCLLVFSCSNLRQT